MKVSIIIPTYNEEKVIGKCITSLQQQSFKDFEIIVVNDGSTDKTFDILSDSTIQNSQFKILKQDHRGPGVARNLGAESANGNILVFVDSDMTFERDFIEKLVAPIIQGKTSGTWSREEYVSNWDNVWARCWNINEGWEDRKRHPKGYPNKQKVFRAILKSEFGRVGGFSLTGYTDDWTLPDKLGYLAINAPGAKFYHKNPDALGEVFAQSQWIGKREYKLGKIGTLIAIARSSFPISIVIGITKAVLNGVPQFLFFKLVYDFGIFMGALESFFGGKRAK